MTHIDLEEQIVDLKLDSDRDELQENLELVGDDIEKIDKVHPGELSTPFAPVTSTLPPPPNGGTLAWLQVLGCFFLWFASLGTVISFGIFQDFYLENYLSEYSPSDIAWIGTIQGFLLFGAGALSGPLFDRGYLRELVIAGAVFMTVGMMTASVARSYYSIFLSLGLCTGIGTSFLFTPSVAVIGTYFTTLRSIAQGISASGGGIGMVLYPAIFKPLVNKVGFGWTLRIIAFINLAGLIIAILLLKQRPTPNKPRGLIDFTAFREARFNVMALASVFMFAGAYTPFYFIAVYGVEKLQLTQSMSYNMLAIAGAGSTLGRLFPALAAIKYGPLPVFALCILICGMLQFIWGAVHDLGGLVSFAFFYGFFGGAVAGTAPVACMEMAPNIHIAGTRVGMLLLIGAVGVLVGNPIAGAILNGPSEFEGLQAFSGAVLLVASILVVTAYELLMKWRKTQHGTATI